jgi:hypothetical protein
MALFAKDRSGQRGDRSGKGGKKYHQKRGDDVAVFRIAARDTSNQQSCGKANQALCDLQKKLVFYTIRSWE